MFKNESEQAKGINFDLQFFAEPGEDPGTPPNNEPAVNTAPPVNASKAVISPDTTVGQTAQQPVNYEQQYNAAIKGMNEAQRERAEWANIAKEYGFNSPEEAKQAFVSHQEYQALLNNPFPAILETLKNNPMQAAQIFGQVFNNQQPQTDPYAKYAEYDNMPDLVKTIQSDILGQVEKIVQPIQQNFQSQYEAGVKNRENARIPEASREAVWNEVKRIGIPMATIDAQPWIIDGLIIQLSGGREKYEESIRTAATAATVQKVTDKITQNNNVATVSPSGSQVGIIQEPITDPKQRLNAALAKVRALNAAAKT